MFLPVCLYGYTTVALRFTLSTYNKHYVIPYANLRKRKYVLGTGQIFSGLGLFNLAYHQLGGDQSNQDHER